MFSNYLKITLRNLYKEKMYAVINISGLSLGLACCIIIGLFLHSEFTYDRHNLKHERIFRIAEEWNINGQIRSSGSTPGELAPRLARDYPEIESYVRFLAIGRELFSYEGESFYWRDGTYLADETVFDIFTHDIIYGDPKTALSDPNSMAISKSFAKKVFGDINPIGKIVATDSELNKVTLVFADLPENSHLKYDVLLSMNRLKLDLNIFGYSICRTYLLMPEGYRAASFQNIWESFCARYVDKILDKGTSPRIWLQPLASLYLNTETQHDYVQRGNRLHLFAFTAVAIFILMIACINYMNLATARSMKRGREVGMRKVLGAARPQLIAQFLGESIFFAFISLVIGLVLVEVVTAFIPINDLIGKQELMNFNDDKPVMLLWMLGFSLIVGLIAGFYPAFYLSSAPIMTTLTGTNRPGKKGFRIRQALVLIQFIISIAFIGSTILMALQMQYVVNKPLGLNKENQVVIRLRGADLIEKVPAMKTELLKEKRILGISRTRLPPGRGVLSWTFAMENNEGVMEKTRSINLMRVKEDFVKVMGMKLAAGRDFSEKIPTDIGKSVLVNETLVKMMGWKEPLGKRILVDDTVFLRVIGVVNNFHYHSLHQQIEPIIIRNIREDFSKQSPVEREQETSYLVLNISEEKISETLKYIQEVFAEFDPGNPFEYEFLIDILDRLYVSEQRLMKLTGIFSGICILISCLGLFGLAAFTTEQRTKEIGVRKVLGASTFQIITMLSRGIILIVLAASVIASLIAWYAIDEWLTGFAYHAGINPLVFVLSAAIAMAVAFGTVALQAFKTANENPVEALRYE